MKILSKILRKKESQSPLEFAEVQNRFQDFLRVLELNNDTLKRISDLEEKSSGDYLFDMEFVHQNINELDKQIEEIIRALNSLSKNRYHELWQAFETIRSDIRANIPGHSTVEPDEQVLFFEELDLKSANRVGGKCANLGELKKQIGLSVPDGFAITAFASIKFLENNQLTERIQREIAAIDLKNIDTLINVSKTIQEAIRTADIHHELLQKIQMAVEKLQAADPQIRFAIRSSAIGEDSQFSFAGQYASYLNVPPSQVPHYYKQVLASQFTPRAMYYYLCQGMKESQLTMGVACMKMVNSLAAGVVYTVNPLQPEKEELIINSVFGLGKLVVDGSITPDTFVVDKNTNEVVFQEIADKTIQLNLDSNGGIIESQLPEEKRQTPSLTRDQIAQLAEVARKIEDHYDEPQDIEWAIDEKGDLFILQTRPLRTYRKPTEIPEIDCDSIPVIFSGGMAAADGVGGGRVFHLQEEQDLLRCPEGAVVVAPTPFPALVMIMNRVNAIVTEVGGIAGHMATVAREFRIPTLMNVKNARQLLPEGTEVTVDADRLRIYEGVHSELIAKHQSRKNLFEDTALFVTLERLLKRIVPLHLISPRSPDFLARNCRTYHDILRFAHQKALYEMFQVVEMSKSCFSKAPKLKSEIPLPIRILFIDSDLSHLHQKEELLENEIPSAPMIAFWKGVKAIGWPSPPAPDFKGFVSVLATSMSTGENIQSQFLETSFALLSREYMNLSIRMGYHFSTIEALCTDTPNKNYIRLRFQEGGASMDRRRRRIRLITNILKHYGFDNYSKGDFLDSSLSHCEKDPLLEKLTVLGAISVLTKQLDMVLSNDEITAWYEQDIMKKLEKLEL